MTGADFTITMVMIAAAVVSAGSFSVIAGYLFNRGLADRNVRAPDIKALYRLYIMHTRKQTGRIGIAIWIHFVSAGVFVLTGTVYTIVRFVLPRFF